MSKGSRFDEINRFVEYDREKLANKVAIILTFIAFPYIFVFYPYSKLLSILIVPVITCFLSVIFLNKKKLHLLANYVLITSATLSATLYSASFGENTDIHLIIFAYIGLPFIIFKLEDTKNIITCLVIQILCLLYLEVTNFHSPFIISLSSSIENIIHITATIVVFILISIYFWFFKVSNNLHISKLINTSIELEKSTDTNEKLAPQSTYARLVKGIAHEIRNPIAGMYTCAELVKEEPDDVEEVTRLCDVVIENLGRLNKLTNAMLKYGGTSTVDQKLFDSTPMIEGMVSIAKAGFQKKGVALLTDLKGTSHIYANETFIHSAISNLLANALQYTDTGEVKISSEETSYIDLKGKTRNGIKISVSDSGTGISENDLNNIFDPYFTKKKSETNVGLGLSMAYKFVTESNGKIIVSSKLGEGTTFDVFLPSEAS